MIMFPRDFICIFLLSCLNRKTMEAAFEHAAELVTSLKTTPDNDTLLELYAFYKQATVGDNMLPKPSMFDMKGSAKWKAWKEVQGMSKVDAMRNYIYLVKTLVEA